MGFAERQRLIHRLADLPGSSGGVAQGFTSVFT
jgi:hypothetical protein